MATKSVPSPLQYKKLLEGCQENAEARHAPLEDQLNAWPALKPETLSTPDFNKPPENWNLWVNTYWALFNMQIKEWKWNDHVQIFHSWIYSEEHEGPVLSWSWDLWILTDSGFPKMPLLHRKNPTKWATLILSNFVFTTPLHTHIHSLYAFTCSDYHLEKGTRRRKKFGVRWTQVWNPPTHDSN